jgi:hypothetical protein
MRYTLVPAYGRDYKSKKAVLADFEADMDFTIESIQGSTYCDRTTLIEAGAREVNIRYSNLRKVCVVQL